MVNLFFCYLGISESQMKTIYYFIVLLGVINAGLLIWEYRAFRRRLRDIDLKKFARGRLIRRSAGILLLFIACGMVIAGESVEFSKQSKWQFFLYWGICLLSVIGAVVIVVIDLKYTAREFLVHQKRLLNDTIELYRSQLSQRINSNKKSND